MKEKQGWTKLNLLIVTACLSILFISAKTTSIKHLKFQQSEPFLRYIAVVNSTMKGKNRIMLRIILYIPVY